MKLAKLSLEQLIKIPETKILKFKTPLNNVQYPLGKIDFIVNYFGTRTDNPELLEDIRVAAGEMIANAICHGNHFNPEKEIKLYCSWIKNIFYFVVKDEGEGFDINNPRYLSAPPPEASLGLACTRQRTSLVYNFKDSASYVCKELPQKQKYATTLEKILLERLVTAFNRIFQKKVAVCELKN